MSIMPTGYRRKSPGYSRIDKSRSPRCEGTLTCLCGLSVILGLAVQVKINCRRYTSFTNSDEVSGRKSNLKAEKAIGEAGSADPPGVERVGTSEEYPPSIGENRIT